MAETRLTVSEIEALARAALMRAGASAAQAGPTAAAIAAAEREGNPICGLVYVPVFCEQLRAGAVHGTAEPVLARPAPGAVTVDAAHGFAHPAIALGLPLLAEAARETGVAGLGVTRSYNCLSVGQFVEALAGQGLIGLGFANTPASMAPPGGRVAVLGTNPIACAAPGPDGVAFVVDQSATAVARTPILMAAAAGRPIPEGWALDAAGHPTTDPTAALEGTMLPAGGTRGFGIALVVELLAAALTGAQLGPQAAPFGGSGAELPGVGQFFLAIDPARFSGGAYAARIVALVRSVADQPGARLPGARRSEARDAADRDGIAVDPRFLAEVRDLAWPPRGVAFMPRPEPPSRPRER